MLSQCYRAVGEAAEAGRGRGGSAHVFVPCRGLGVAGITHERTSAQVGLIVVPCSAGTFLWGAWHKMASADTAQR